MRRLAPRLGSLLIVAASVALCATRARASYEEFSTLDVGREEEDDENLLDHVLVRPPEGWQDEWQRAASAFRTSQGCFTSGQWYLDHELKAKVPMGDTTYMVLGIRDVSDDESTYGWTQFDLRFPIRRAGLWGVRFRPTFDKSQQDAAILWDQGSDTTRFQVQATFGLEDLFNKFWALRQVRVGDDSAPYERHPYEPALHVAWRGTGPDLDVNGKWLTPSRKRFDTHDPALRRHELLWGVKHDATLAQGLGRWRGTLRFEQVQASSFAYWEQQSGDHHLFRRRWRGEGELTRPVGEHGSFTLRYFYQERTQVYRPPISNALLDAIDRMPMVEGSFRAGRGLGIRTGFMRDRITVVDDGNAPVSTYGTRVETRAFISLQRRFGRVRLEGMECIELDKEPYPVTFHHDKGFVHIQTTF